MYVVEYGTTIHPQLMQILLCLISIMTAPFTAYAVWNVSHNSTGDYVNLAGTDVGVLPYKIAPKKRILSESRTIGPGSVSP
jgi:hypothetical protein